ncbi:MAG: lysine--tRNA ligase [Candidatus Azosocius agrarius]|nr:MAG: lysine--tRNA ligase [Gammaproteobacteria bacterium]
MNLRKENFSRRRKIDNFSDIDLYPNFFRKVNNISDIYLFYKDLFIDKFFFEDMFFLLSGRIISKRFFGKASFLNLQDFSGNIQLYVKKENLSLDSYKFFELLDVGDIVWVYGILFLTNTEMLSLKVYDLRLLVKSLSSFPSKWSGLQDKELCYRNRYLDLIVNKKTKKIFLIRLKLIQFIRNFFLNMNFLEIETPMMHSIPGGATARPFKTFHNSLGINLYLRIAPELYLKKLIIGGFEKIFEINRSFRNEGLSVRHNSEFTMIEFYQAYVDYRYLMELTELLIKKLYQYLFNDINLFDIIDLNNNFDCITMFDSILKYTNLNFNVISDLDLLKNELNLLNISFDISWNIKKLQVILFEALVENKLKKPTFIIDYPVEVSPLSKHSNINIGKTDRFEFYINGFEIANGFSELNDSVLQSDKFKKQIIDIDIKKDNNIYYDESYIKALEYGLPPTAGEGIGIDRLVMIFTGSLSIKDVILFPLMKN